jgi:tetratricopeptide (TPR) repeat protein
MFIINIYLRLALIAFGFIGGGIMIATLGFWYGFPFVLMAIILLVGYFIMGTVQSAGQLFQMQDVEGAEKRLAMTIKPEWLYEPNQAAYYLFKGMFCVHRQEYEAGEKLLLKAASFPMLGNNEKASIYLQLANIHGNKQRWAIAMNYLKKAKEYKVTEPMIKEQIAQTDKALAQRGQMQASMRMGNGFRTGGGKRRQPRVR